MKAVSFQLENPKAAIHLMTTRRQWPQFRVMGQACDELREADN